MERERCGWCKGDALYEAYHDKEWGLPEHDDRRLFEFLILEGAQAGLSWITVLRKRENYRRLMADFDPAVLAGWGDAEVAAWLQEPGIIRNRLKLHGTLQNARAFLRVQAEFGSFDAYLWRFVDGKPVQNNWRTLQEVPAETPLAQQLSKDLKKRGFTFVGPTICYALMQAVGLVNDHLTSCFRHQEVQNVIR
jgi:DNA-3-methyladenine glycosylase I